MIDLTKAFISADLSKIEDKALTQLGNIVSLPFLRRWAVLPDMHCGYGVPIGCVVATDPDVVIPNAIGVDVGCVDKDTEFLSPEGWIPISAWNGQQVMQFCPAEECSSFVQPLRYIRVPCKEFIHFKTKYGIDQMLSPEHRCLVYSRTRHNASCSTYDTDTAENIFNQHAKLKLGYRHRFNTTFSPILTTAVPLSDTELRIMVAVCADGHVSSKNRIRFRFKKQRKIKRLTKLLINADIPFTSKEEPDGATAIYCTPPAYKRGIHRFWNASLPQLQLISDEVLHWDGNLKDSVFFTRIKEEADFVQYAMAASGYRATLRKDGPDYRVFRLNNTKIGMAGTPKTIMHRVPSPDGYKYCFTVPSSYLVLRRNGNIFITGNCGMAAVRTNVSSCQLDRSDLEELCREIRASTPVGFNKRRLPVLRSEMPNKLMTMDMAVHYDNAALQLGTLGGGNHFIEIQADQDGYVWVMIHSGSRNLGKQVCDHYNAIAKKWNARMYSKVEPGVDLAFLHRDLVEYQDYMQDMAYCVDYAKRNRAKMIDGVRAAFMRVLGGSSIKMPWGEVYDICHNHAAMEHHLGKNMMVHRKGAAGPYLGDTVGIIPGSQGTASYLVKYKDTACPTAMRTTSHGAGRAMGRNAAKKALSLSETLDGMREIVHGIRSEGDLDEAPGAYKDIDEVMALQNDLCVITTKLRPLAVVKG